VSRTERDIIVVIRQASTTQLRRAAVVAVALAAAGGAAIYGGTGAGAASAPSISQVQAQVNALQTRVDKVGQQYDAADQQVAAAQARLAQVTREMASAQQAYDTARAGLTAVAVAAYENANQTSVLGLLSSGNPSAVLSQASLVLEVAGAHNAQAAQFLTAAQDLASIRLQRQRTEEGVAQVKAQLAAQKSTLTTLLAHRTATLDSLTAAQQQQVAAETIGAAQPASASPAGTGQTGGSQTGGSQTGTPPVSYSGPTSTQADQAVAFAYAQIGKPYVWGATGPDAYDCSGLVQAAWAAAGVSIPRTTYEQWATLPHIPLADLQPGDLIIYDGEGHVGMYVGNGYIIDAPSTGLDVERIPMDTPWYADNTDGALRP
jgi:cell wall-associated NlpC family hydrolase